MGDKPPRVFISYAWEDDVNEWVSKFALHLRDNGIDARIDQWETKFGDHLTEYMEKSIKQNDFVLIICTPLYRKKADGRTGGVGYEGHIITAEIFRTANHRKFIPVLLKGKANLGIPLFLQGKYCCDLRGGSDQSSNWTDF